MKITYEEPFRTRESRRHLLPYLATDTVLSYGQVLRWAAITAGIQMTVTDVYYDGRQNIIALIARLTSASFLAFK